MELKRVRCTQCGAEFENTDLSTRLVKCARVGCGATFFVDQGAEFARVESAKAEKIKELRGALREAVESRHYELMKTRAADIQALLPMDFYANLCFALAEDKLKANPMRYEGMLSSPPQCTNDEAEAAVRLAFDNFDIHNELAIDHFIRAHFTDKARDTRLVKLSEISAAWKLKQEDYENVPRDVFVCHSSSDGAVADAVYDLLNKEGFKCWSSRKNMPPDTRDYEKRIQNALENCRLVVVVASEQCMLRPDPRTEIQTAIKLGKILVEFKIDKTPHTELFKLCFKGNQWVEGDRLSAKQYQALARRVARDLQGGEAPEEAELEADGPTAKAVLRREEKAREKEAKKEGRPPKGKIRRARHRAGLARCGRYKLGKLVLFLALLCFAVVFYVSLQAETGKLASIAKQFPSAQTLNNALVRVTNQIRRELPMQWREYLRVAGLSFVTALGLLCMIALSLPFTRYAVRRACTLAILCDVACAIIALSEVVIPALRKAEEVTNMEGALVLGFQMLWPMAAAFVAACFVRALAARSVRSVRKSEQFLAAQSRA